MEAAKFLNQPENREAARTISQHVLAEVEPGELEVSVGLIDPLLDMSAQGEMVTADSSDEAGGFGGSDLLVMVVVPLVVTVLGDLLVELGKVGIKEIKEKLEQRKDAKDLILVASSSNVDAVVRRAQSLRGAGRKKELTRALATVLFEYLEVE